MVGGEDDIVASIEPILRTIAPGVDAAERTPGRSGEPGQEEYGYLHCGPSGAGHFVKMVHNGIEYGDMQLICESYQIMKELLGMSPDEVGRYWIDRKVRGQSAAPRSLPSAAHVAKVAAKFPGAIGYLPADQLTSDIQAVPDSISIARRTQAIAWQNVVFALTIKAVVMVLGLAGFASMWMAVFADSGVAMLCVLNSIRLLYRKR
jgi:hypothetical protein